MIRSPSSTRRAAQRSFTASACTTNACAAPTLTQGSLWSRGTTPRRASATANACPVTRWNNGVSYPIQSGHGCIGCAEQNFWDHGSFYSRITNIPQFGTNTTAETVGVAAVAGIGAGVVTHAAISTAVHLKHRYGKDGDCSKETKTAQAEKTDSNDSTPSERN